LNGQITELIDQAQAHKRKVGLIKFSKQYLYSGAYDQKIKQWSLNGFRMVASFNIPWIPTSIDVYNETMLIGGSQIVSSIALSVFDTVSENFKSINTVSNKKTATGEQYSVSSINTVVIITATLGVIFIFGLLFLFIRRRFSKVKAENQSSDLTQASLTETLVTTILKISLPGYKELQAVEFRTVTKLAEGGGGVVYLGEGLSKRSRILGNQIVIKILSGYTCFMLISGRFNQMEFLHQLSFNQEISLMEFFGDSPFTAKLIGYCKEPVCLLMKYYENGSLSSWIDKNISVLARNTSLKLSILTDVCKGINLMHGRQVAHCDLKPQNILVNIEQNRYFFVLTDFGISKILTAQYLASQAFQIRNLRGLTLNYAAPDVMKRFRNKLFGTAIEEKAGDVYSIGCLAYYVLTLNDPW
jgi:hypothetical protein